MWLLVYYRNFYLGWVKNRVGCDVVIQTSSLLFYQFWSLCMLKLIRLKLWFLLLNFGNSFFELGVRNRFLALFTTSSCGGHFGYGVGEVVFFLNVFGIWFPRQYMKKKFFGIISTLLYSTLLYSTLLYSTLLYSTLLYSTCCMGLIAYAEGPLCLAPSQWT